MFLRVCSTGSPGGWTGRVGGDRVITYLFEVAPSSYIGAISVGITIKRHIH